MPKILRLNRGILYDMKNATSDQELSKFLDGQLEDAPRQFGSFDIVVPTHLADIFDKEAEALMKVYTEGLKNATGD